MYLYKYIFINLHISLYMYIYIYIYLSIYLSIFLYIFDRNRRPACQPATLRSATPAFHPPFTRHFSSYTSILDDI